MNTKTAFSVLNFVLRMTLALFVLIMVISCEQNRKREILKTQAKQLKVAQSRPPVNPSKTIVDSMSNGRQDSISLFGINETILGNGDTVTFVSVSEIDSLSRKIDSLVIPDLKGKTSEQTKYFELKSKYRRRLLVSTGISETDSMFIYDYAKDTLLKYPINSLRVVANLNPYENSSDAIHSEDDYMLGFKIDRASLASGLSHNYFNTTYVYIGTKNPFTKGQMKPIVWKKTDGKKIPQTQQSTEEAEVLKGFKFGDAYTFISNNYQFYLQAFSKIGISHPEIDESSPERLLIVNANKKVVFNRVYYESEGESPAPLSFINGRKNSLEQWTGRLLKNKPPVMLGFEYLDFGCPTLPFVDETNGYVDFMCDNRH